jgi:hypothetical protein
MRRPLYQGVLKSLNSFLILALSELLDLEGHLLVPLLDLLLLYKSNINVCRIVLL